jgi:hypothetical protein
MTCNNGRPSSDSVNLGSNPSPPATTNPDKTGVSGNLSPSEKPERAEQTAHTGRTKVGTVLVCGGRGYRDRERVFAELNALDRRHGLTALIHGGASGADTLAGMWAREWGLTVWVYPAEWAKHGKAAGPIRNQDMIDRGKPDLVVAFPGGKGTADMVRRARAANIPTIEVRP